MTSSPPTHVHSADYFGDSRDHWWNADFLQLLSQRLDLRAARDVLDVGSGFGHFTRALIPALHPEARVTGIEPEAASVAEANRRSPTLRFLEGRVEALPFDDASFDLVCCQTVLIHVPDPVAALVEMKRVLRPGGRLFAVEPVNLVASLPLQARARGAALEDVEAMFHLQLRCEEGKIRSGEGDNSLGERLPGLVHNAFFSAIQVFQTDRPWPMLPPYTQPHEPPTIAELRVAVAQDLAVWRRDTTLRYYLAGGGAEADFERLWQLAVRENHLLLAAIDAGTYAQAGALMGVIVTARKPA